MGKSKYIEKIRELFDKSPIVDFKSIERAVKIKKKKNSYAKLLISNMIKKAEVKKVAKGFYTKHNDNSLCVLCYAPAYLGLQSALSIHGLWAQETIPVVITAKKIRTGIRKVLGGNILVKRTKQKYIFGFDYLEDGSFYLPYSDVEKTFIDMFVFKQNIDDDVLKEFIKRIDKKKLEEYLKMYDRKLKESVLRKLK